MFSKTICISFTFILSTLLFAQKNKVAKTYPDSIAPVGIIKGLSDSELLDIVQRQTFRYFWHFAHPVSGLARERDNTVKANFYWNLFMKIPEIQKGLKELGFSSSFKQK